MNKFKFKNGQKFGAFIEKQASNSPLQFFEIIDADYIEGAFACALVKWTESDGLASRPSSNALRYYDITSGDVNDFTMHGIIRCTLVKNEYDELALKLKYASRK